MAYAAAIVSATRPDLVAWTDGNASWPHKNHFRNKVFQWLVYPILRHRQYILFDHDYMDMRHPEIIVHVPSNYYDRSPDEFDIWRQ